MKIARLLLLVGTVTFVFGGCTGRLIKEGLGTVQGASGSYVEVPSMGPKELRPLGQYHNFEVGQITDQFGRTPPELMRLIPIEIRRYLREEKLPTGKMGKTAIIQGKVLYYEKAGTMGQLFGPLEEVIAHMQLVDKDTGQIIAQADCVGRTTASVNAGIAKKAQGLGKAVADWISNRYPETAGRVEYAE